MWRVKRFQHRLDEYSHEEFRHNASTLKLVYRPDRELADDKWRAIITDIHLCVPNNNSSDASAQNTTHYSTCTSTEKHIDSMYRLVSICFRANRFCLRGNRAYLCPLCVVPDCAWMATGEMETRRGKINLFCRCRPMDSAVSNIDRLQLCIISTYSLYKSFLRRDFSPAPVPALIDFRHRINPLAAEEIKFRQNENVRRPTRNVFVYADSNVFQTISNSSAILRISQVIWIDCSIWWQYVWRIEPLCELIDTILAKNHPKSAIVSSNNSELNFLPSILWLFYACWITRHFSRHAWSRCSRFIFHSI